jgi:hypothetical protein
VIALPARPPTTVAITTAARTLVPGNPLWILGTSTLALITLALITHPLA